MKNEPEFIRGNQKSYIRVSCEESLLGCYEYQMCSHNHISSLLEFKQRSENGKLFLYYEISGMQSLDIYLQAHKLKRAFAIKLVNALLKVSRELSEYALELEKINFMPRYVMVTAEEEFRFIYGFFKVDENSEEFEKFLEVGIDYIDYQDELLMKKMFEFYERFLQQKNNFSLEKEALGLRDILTEALAGENVDKNSHNQDIKWIEEKTEKQNDNSVQIEKKEWWKIKKEILIILILDVSLMFFWKPLTMLKIFFVIAVGIVMLILNLFLYKKEKVKEMSSAGAEQDAVFLEEYENLIGQSGEENNYTQFIVVEESEGVLYNLQEREPKYIYINDAPKIIGKDSEKAQIVVGYEGVSRLHALVIKEGKECMVEDLNSTNGTKLNEKLLEPRKRYVLQQGDKVSFAGVEYIFR